MSVLVIFFFAYLMSFAMRIMPLFLTDSKEEAYIANSTFTIAFKHHYHICVIAVFWMNPC